MLGFVPQPQPTWSDNRINGISETSGVLRLGNTRDERMKNYRALYSHHVEGDLLKKGTLPFSGVKKGTLPFSGVDVEDIQVLRGHILSFKYRLTIS